MGNIKDKLSNDKNDKIEFLDSRKKQQNDFILEKIINNELNKIDQNNDKKRQNHEYRQRLKQIEDEKIKLEEGLKKKKEHKKYLKTALKQHVDEYGEKVKVKGVGKG